MAAPPVVTTPRACALITGATSGIGLALADCLAAAGHPLLLVARRADELERLASSVRERYRVEVTVVALDLVSAGALERLHDQVMRQGLDIGILINNAGVGAVGAFSASPWAVDERIIHLNILAATELVKRFLPGLLARGEGRILNVASTAAFLPGPLMAVYYASKAYLLSWSQALANECAGSGVTVTALCPGPTRTGFELVAGLAGSSLFRSRAVMSAEVVARIGYRAMMRGRRVAVAGWLNRLMAVATRITPTAILMRIARTLHGG